MAKNNDELEGIEVEEDIIINDQDGLPNVHPNLLTENEEDSPQEHTSDDEFDDLPSSLIVTNIHDSVFITPGKLPVFCIWVLYWYKQLPFLNKGVKY